MASVTRCRAHEIAAIQDCGSLPYLGGGLRVKVRPPRASKKKAPVGVGASKGETSKLQRTQVALPDPKFGFGSSQGRSSLPSRIRAGPLRRRNPGARSWAGCDGFHSTLPPSLSHGENTVILGDAPRNAGQLSFYRVVVVVVVVVEDCGLFVSLEDAAAAATATTATAAATIPGVIPPAAAPVAAPAPPAPPAPDVPPAGVCASALAAMNSDTKTTARYFVISSPLAQFG